MAFDAGPGTGFGWTLGRPYRQASLDQAVGQLRDAVAAVHVPVRADFESSFAIDPAACRRGRRVPIPQAGAERVRQTYPEPIMPTGTVQIHRVLRSKPDKIYRAFLDADAISKWIAPYGFTCRVHHMDAKVGGTFKMSFKNFSTGNGHSFGGEYLELVASERIRYTDRFDDPNLPGEIRVTVSIRQVSCGSELTIVQEGIPEVIPLEMCYLGWQESLAQLANLVEPEIPG